MLYYIKKHSEQIAYILFCIGIITLSFFHEPRFDEFQAWAISKESLKNILFLIPHYECHLPLWFLILKCFSFFNVNPEIGIKIPNLCFMMGAIYLLIFKSPFSKTLKLTLPFTFYLFYQYSIINRPYSIFCFAIFGIASIYKTRNEHPLIFILANALLCQSCIYGIAVSAGIIIVWGFEILKNNSYSIKSFIKDRYFIFLLFISIYFILILLEIWPNNSSDKSFYALFDGAEYVSYRNYFLSFVYSVSGIFSEITFLNCFNFIIESLCTCETNEFFNIFNMPSLEYFIHSAKFLFICFFGLLIHIFLIFEFKKYNVFLLYIIPYLFLLILYTIHFAPHHIGLLLIFIIFIYWCGLDSYNCSNNLNRIFITLFIIFQLFYSSISAFYEIVYPTSPARQIALYLKINNLDNYKIMGSWLDFSVYRNKKTKKIKFDEPGYLYFDSDGLYKKIEYKDFNQLLLPVVITQYFNKNIFYNLNPDNSKKEYILFKLSSKAQNEKLKLIINSKGLPDIIIGEVQIKDFFDSEAVYNTNYKLEKSFTSYSFYKNNLSERKYNLYIKDNLGGK